MVQVSLGQKIKCQRVACARHCQPSDGLRKKQDPISKTTRAKRAGHVAQVVKCLLLKHKGLSSNPHTTKKKVAKLKNRLLISSLPNRHMY
jgi:hypothetical protein